MVFVHIQNICKYNIVSMPFFMSVKTTPSFISRTRKDFYFKFGLHDVIIKRRNVTKVLDLWNSLKKKVLEIETCKSYNYTYFVGQGLNKLYNTWLYACGFIITTEIKENYGLN